MILMLLETVVGTPFQNCYQSQFMRCIYFILFFFKFWKHLAFGPVQCYSTSASTFVRVGAGCHFMLLNIKSTLKGHRFVVTFEKSQKVYHRL